VDDEPHLIEITALLRETTARLVGPEDEETSLCDVAEVIGRAMSAWCVVTLLGSGRAATIAAFPSAARALDESACRKGDGPSMTAIRERTTVFSPDLSHEARWPHWRSHAATLGVRSVMAIPMDVDADGIGAVTLYAAQPDAFADRRQLTAHLAVEHLGLLLGGLHRRRTAPKTGSDSDPSVLHRAVGLLMAQRGCTPQEAIQLLEAAATSSRLAVPDVARRLVDAVHGGAPIWR
jgi:transcriptional regulator with GAF, ATPase, and Fis domain